MFVFASALVTGASIDVLLILTRVRRERNQNATEGVTDLLETMPSFIGERFVLLTSTDEQSMKYS